MRCAVAVAEAEPGLAGAHLIGQSPSPGHHDDGTRRGGNGIEPGGKLARADDAAAELDDDQARVTAGGRRFGMRAQGLGPPSSSRFP